MSTSTALHTALRDAYLAQLDDDAAIHGYMLLWEQLVETQGPDGARVLFKSVMASLPADKRSDVYPDGDC